MQVSGFQISRSASRWSRNHAPACSSILIPVVSRQFNTSFCVAEQFHLLSSLHDPQCCRSMVWSVRREGGTGFECLRQARPKANLVQAQAASTTTQTGSALHMPSSRGSCTQPGKLDSRHRDRVRYIRVPFEKLRGVVVLGICYEHHTPALRRCLEGYSTIVIATATATATALLMLGTD